MSRVKFGLRVLFLCVFLSFKYTYMSSIFLCMMQLNSFCLVTVSVEYGAYMCLYMVVCVCVVAGGSYEWAAAAWLSGQYGQLMNEMEIIKINCRWCSNIHAAGLHIFLTHLPSQRCTPCWCNGHKYLKHKVMEFVRDRCKNSCEILTW